VFKHAIGWARAVSEKCSQNVVTVVLFAHFQNLTTAGETRDFVSDDRLMETRKSLADGVGSVLHETPHVPWAVFEVDPNHTAYAKAPGVSTRCQIELV
jgi:hypothetical protein